MNIKINRRESKVKKLIKFYLYDIDSQMVWQGQYWTGSLKQALLFGIRSDAEAESRRQYAKLNKLLSEF